MEAPGTLLVKADATGGVLGHVTVNGGHARGL